MDWAVDMYVLGSRYFPRAKAESSERVAEGKGGRMVPLLDAINNGIKLYREQGVITEGSAFQYDQHPNDFVLQLIPPTIGNSTPVGRAVVEMATSLRPWLAESSMELVDHEVLFARIEKDTYCELCECNLLLPAASCLGVVAARRAAPGARWAAYRRVAADFAAAAENALDRSVPAVEEYDRPTISALCVLGDDDASTEVVRELYSDYDSMFGRESLASALRCATSESFSYSSLLLACDCLPIPTKQSKEWMKCLRRCLRALCWRDPAETIVGLLNACPFQEFLKLLRNMRRVRAFDAPEDDEWSFLILTTLAIFDDSYSHLNSQYFDHSGRTSERLECLCALSRCKLGISLLSELRKIEPRCLPRGPDARARAETLISISRSPSGAMSPAFSTQETAALLCEWAGELLDERDLDDAVLDALREFSNLPISKRTHAWTYSLDALSLRVDEILNVERGPLPWFLARSSSKFRTFAREAVQEAARTRAVFDSDRVVVLCLWFPVDQRDKHSIRIFARRFADPTTVDMNDTIYEFEDGLRRAWVSFSRDLSENGATRRKFRGRFDRPRLDDATDAVLAAASEHRKCVAMCSDVDKWTAAGRPSVSVVHWAQARALRIR
jgi:hypothetical protein